MRNPSRNASTAGSISPSPDSKRRRFVFTLGLGGAGVASGAVASVAATAVDVTTPEIAASEGGYRESAHVRDYYRTAKL